MKIDGYYTKENSLLTFRYADGKDRDIEGNILPNDYVVFVHIKDCSVCNDESGKPYYDSSKAPIIPVSYIKPTYGVGEFKVKEKTEGIEIDGKFVYEYNQATMYFAYSGKVYTASLKDLIE